VVLALQDRFVIDSGATDILLDVLANDSTSGSPLKLTTVSVSNSGTATINPAGDSLFFTPAAEFSGDTWIQYIADSRVLR
jgi:hypothetical protein